MVIKNVYVNNRWVLGILAAGLIAAGLAFNWSWLVAAGVVPVLIALAPCALMCAFGLCMSRTGGKSCKAKSSNGEASNRGEDSRG